MSDLKEPKLLENIEHNEDYPEQAMTNDQFNSSRQAMNMDQTQLFNTITSNIQSQEQGDQKRFKLFVTGGTETEKTFLFNLLKNQVNRCYGKQVTKIGALTGVAARLVGGSTLHALITSSKRRRLSERASTLWKLLENYASTLAKCRVLDDEFVDEISKVPYEMLCVINAPLRHLKNNDDPFGGINVMLFGDLIQLPSVHGK
ncbi:unnamed protein product [Parnassius apollo]|uniref:ATP-dependent DNA helicase n=1 Tax=Parnassius apollo TaxID=110799 RepID=A0A8S3XGU7_PARAO|nr:unnamed protein product [Parnassius apollo]